MLEPFEPLEPAIQMALDCTAPAHHAWHAFREAFQSGEAPVEMALGLWEAHEETITAGATLFHQVLTGDAPVDLLLSSGYCHYGLVTALFVLATPKSIAMAQRLLGMSAALDFLEDSAWPLTSQDLEKTERTLDLISVIQSQIPFMWPPFLKQNGLQKLFPSEHFIHLRHLRSSFSFASFGVHPSLSADVVYALQALLPESHARYFGLSCPQAASHHCHFRCEVLGQCEDDLVYKEILKQMMDFGDFTERSYDPEALKQEFHLIISSEQYFKAIDFQICTGPFILCHFVYEILSKPLLVYLGLALTYLAPQNVEDLLISARSMATGA